MRTLFAITLLVFTTATQASWLEGKMMGVHVGQISYDTDGLYDDYRFDDQTSSWGLYGAAPVTDWLDLEVHYNYLGGYEIKDSVFHYWKDRFHSLTTTARFHTHLTPQWSIYARAGFGVVLLDQKAIIWEGGSQLDTASGGGDIHLGAGLAWQFHSKLALTLDYQLHSFLMESGYSDYQQTLSGFNAGLRYTF
ncbi:outer membrane beta-barrel protein [Ferrimonas balearica]|uniref:outer membrane beta-barrel protein n=1 Tax=Ferrimonas balearica TaxID=44012 RepID=UPI001C5AEECD|nr:outer membrane beta-barrel protein [Ferrimonas balearica]MBW3166018.1 porin family protein [Ferrimonas balearica]